MWGSVERVRSGDETEEQVVVLQRYLRLIRHAGVDCEPSELTYMEAFVHGVAAAAAWSMEIVEISPLTGQVLAVDTNTATQVCEDAEVVMLGVDGQTNVNYAAGVWAWMSWAIGHADEIEYPR